MLPNKFRYKVELWGKVKVENDMHQTQHIDSKVSDVWADFVPQTRYLQKQREAETILTNVTHKIVMRFAQDIAPNMWFRYKGKRFDIRYILNPHFLNETLEVFVEEVIE